MTPKTREQQAREKAEEIINKWVEDHSIDIFICGDSTKPSLLDAFSQALLSFPSAEPASEEEQRQLSREYQERLSAADNYTQHDLEIQGRAFRVGFRAGKKLKQANGESLKQAYKEEALVARILIDKTPLSELNAADSVGFDVYNWKRSNTEKLEMEGGGK